MKIELSGVSFTYPGGVQALQDINLRVAAGEAVALIGENGAGKTTLVRHLNGLLKPGAGEVIIGDWNTRDHTVAQMAARVGYVFQNPDDQLIERTVKEEVAFGPRKLGYDQTTVEAGVTAALEQVGLSDQANSHPYDLSQSQRKLVSLASVLSMRTPIVILDEPTTGQDAAGIERIGAIVEALKVEGRTILTITHDIDFCAEHFDRVVVMSAGRIVADGPAGDILRQEALLRSAGVEPPQLVRLALALGLQGAPLTVEAFITSLSGRSETRRAAPQD